jgi:hypothetical protein
MVGQDLLFSKARCMAFKCWIKAAGSPAVSASSRFTARQGMQPPNEGAIITNLAPQIDGLLCAGFQGRQVIGFTGANPHVQQRI